jgi:AbrB family looped-hinge helix DNA binding protein
VEQSVRVRVSEKGRVVIPASFRKALGIRAGGVVDLRIEDDELRIATIEHRLRATRRRLKKVFGSGRVLSDELIAERREESRRELDSSGA